MVEIVSTFMGEQRRVVGRARTNNGTVRALRRCTFGGGWGALVRGTQTALEAVGAYCVDTGDTGAVAMVLPACGHYVHCVVGG
jgi:hypothetical protein